MGVVGSKVALIVTGTAEELDAFFVVGMVLWLAFAFAALLPALNNALRGEGPARVHGGIALVVALLIAAALSYFSYVRWAAGG